MEKEEIQKRLDRVSSLLNNILLEAHRSGFDLDVGTMWKKYDNVVHPAVFAKVSVPVAVRAKMLANKVSSESVHNTGVRYTPRVIVDNVK